ncbi:MAG: hypothetical protein ACE5H3_01225 [Planctomycetota bacterium]
MRLFLKSILFGCGLSLALFPAAAACTPQEDSVASRLPAGTLLHLEVPSVDDLRLALEGTDLAALFQDDEVAAFLAPFLQGVRQDLDRLLAPHPAFARFFLDRLPGRSTFSLLSLDEGENGGPSLLFTLELPGRGAASFRGLQDFLVEEGVGRSRFRMRKLAGHPALFFRLWGLSWILAREGDRLLLAIDPETLADFFTGPADSLAEDEAFQAVAGEVRPSRGGMLFLYLDPRGVLRGLGRAVGRLLASGEETPDRTLEVVFGRLFEEGLLPSELRGFGYGLAAQGAALQDRLFLFDPSPRTGWRGTGPVGRAPRNHAAVLPADSALFVSSWFDLGGSLEETRQRKEQMEKIAESFPFSGLGDVFREGLRSADPFEALQASSGLDLEKDLVPLLGHYLSFTVSFPSGAILPDGALIVDLKDGPGMDQLLERLAGHSQGGGWRMSSSAYKDWKLFTLKLPGMGLPILPTFCRVEGRLCVTPYPYSMKALLRGIENGGHLAGEASVSRYLDKAPEDANSLVWFDLEPPFQYLYNFLTLVLGSLGSPGSGDAGGFDPALLPAAGVFTRYLGTGTLTTVTDERGFLMESRSALANPVVTLLGGVAGGAAFFFAAGRLHQHVRRENLETRMEHLEALARALLRYRDSSGGGAFPESLAALLEAGFLEDPGLLADPADPRPEMLARPDGARIPVSYALGEVAALPERVQVRLPMDCKVFLYTRRTLDSRKGGPARTLFPVRTGAGRILLVAETHWQP